MSSSGQAENKILPIQKMLIVGDTYVGKSSLLFKFVDDVFMNESSTIGTDFHIKIYHYNNLQVKLQLWDSVKMMDRHNTISSAYFRGLDAFIVCFDLTNEKSFENVDKWIQKIKRHSSKDAPIYLIGTKADLVDERKVPEDQISLFSFENKMKYFQLSSKTGENVEIAMNHCINEMIEINKDGFEEQIRQRMENKTIQSVPKENESYCQIL
jgi:small GTP-binding protein